MSSMFGMLGAILRGVRSRALLSAGSVLLTALAVASAVLGPIFAGAVTNSYLVTRLREAPPSLTGLSRVFTPDSQQSGADAVRDAVAATDARNEGPWGRTVAIVQSRGSTSSTSAHSSGVDTVAAGTPRTEYALAIVWSRAFWL